MQLAQQVKQIAYNRQRRATLKEQGVCRNCAERPIDEGSRRHCAVCKERDRMRNQCYEFPRPSCSRCWEGHRKGACDKPVGYDPRTGAIT